MKTANLLTGLALSLIASLSLSAAPSLDEELLAIQQEWARANYETPAGQAREAAFDTLSKRAALFTQNHPGRAEPLIWEGIVLSTYAGAKGGLGALGLAKQARDRLEAALKISPDALDGSVYTSLGSLYSKVPGFPVGFGNDKKALEYLKKALALNPDGIDPNYFYGEFLADNGDYPAAARYLEKALQAPPRAHRELADAGRKGEINALLAKVKSKGG